jgi:Putative transposase/Transposase zinc-binding domain
VCDAPLDVGAILRRYAQRGGGADQRLTAPQRQALRDLGACRTPQLGGRLERCSACGLLEYVYNSCRNRHCPKCQAGSRAAWLEREAGCLLPVEYHHLVFTLPHALQGVAADNPRLVYALLFEAASAAVQELAADPKYLGAQVGLTAVLHTWGQTLGLHPHLHVLATGGGLSCDRRGAVDAAPRWRSARPGFFLPVRVLGRLFRGKFLAGLAQAHGRGELLLRPGLAPWRALLAELSGQDWVVYSQPPCAGAEVVLKYLARYVHRVALSNSRLLRVTEEEVTFRWKDYRRHGRQKEMTLGTEEFVRRFLQHVLPRGFVRVRHYGLLANRGREQKLRLCRRLLSAERAAAQVRAAARVDQAEADGRRCRGCGRGVMEVVEGLPRQPPPAGAGPVRPDSS